MRRLVLVVLLACVGAPGGARAAGRSAPELAQVERPPAAEPQGFRPSGFWTSPHRAKGGAYRYRMLGIGAVLLLATGLVTLRLVRRASAQRSRARAEHT